MHLPLSQPRSNIASCVRGKNWQVTLLRNKIHIQRFTESKSIEVMVEYNRLYYHHHYHHHYYCNHQPQQNHFLRSFIHTSPAHCFTFPCKLMTEYSVILERPLTDKFAYSHHLVSGRCIDIVRRR